MAHSILNREDMEMLHEITYSFTERVETVLEKIVQQGGNGNE